jgi:hypothetical protein
MMALTESTIVVALLLVMLGVWIYVMAVNKPPRRVYGRADLDELAPVAVEVIKAPAPKIVMPNNIELKLVTMDADHVRFVQDCEYPRNPPKAYDKRTGLQIDADIVVTYSVKHQKTMRVG